MSSLPSDPTRLMSDLDFVRSLARYLCGDPHMAEDIAQEALVTALERNPQNVRNWRGWLATITRNLLFNKRRDEQRLKAHEEAAATNDTVPSAAEVAESEQVRRRVVAAVMALPEDYRAIVLLRHYRGKTTKECAQQLGIPESTVRTRLQRAIEQLRGKLDADHGGDRKKWLAALAPFALPVETVPIGATGSTTGTATSTGVKPAAAAVFLVAFVGIAVFAIDAMTPSAPPPAEAGSHDTAATETTNPATGSTSPRTGATKAPTPGAQRTSATPGGYVLAGRVKVAGANKPIAGAQVVVVTDPWHHPDSELRLTATTDADGRYEVSLDPIRAWSPLAQHELRVNVHVRADGFLGSQTDARLRKVNSYMPEATIVIMEETIEPPAPLLETSLRPGATVRGRVVTSGGIPVHHARVGFADAKFATLTAPDGTFELKYEGRAATLIAAHLQHGIATPLPIDAASDIGDIALLHHMQTVRGQTVHPNGRPAPNQSLVLEEAASRSGPITFHGVEITRFHYRFCMNRGATRLTDANGNFSFVTLSPGAFTINVNPLYVASSYKLSGKNHPFVVPASGDAPFMRIECPTGHVRVRATDSHGLPVQPQQCAFYTWPAARALEVERQLQASGFTLELLKSAERRVNAEIHRHGIPGRPGMLVVAEACSLGTAPAYAYQRLGPADYSATIDVTLANDPPTGAVQLAEFDRWTLVRACRIPVRDAIGIELPHLETETCCRAIVQTDWHFVPRNGVITKLPTGKVVLEIWRRGGPRIPFRFPTPQDTALYSVDVRPGEVTTVDGPGIPIPALPMNQRQIPEEVLERARTHLKKRRNG